MKQYELTLTGINPLLMHNDNLGAMEKIEAWRKDPANKTLSVSGDDRSPAWTWLAYLYHDGEHIGMPSDNLMTMLREAGSAVPKQGKKTYKQDTQSGLFLDQQQMTLLIDGAPVKVADLKHLNGVTNFVEHIEAAEALGFELMVKRAKIGSAKHVRVRPLFRRWELVGSLTVIDEETSGITRAVLETILRVGGSTKGLGDWRPSSPKSGTFGTFSYRVK